ncbi:MAG: hypothetical protein U0133_06975 [Gemmatimonadales bacterium]
MSRTAAPAEAGLFERLGGVDALERVAGRLVPRLAADPVLAGLVRADTAELRWQIQMILIDRLKGPMAYDGPDPAGLVRHRGIDAAKWRQILGHTLACLAVEAQDETSLAEAERLLEAFGFSLGFGRAPAEPAFDLVSAAVATVAAAGHANRPLFVTGPDLVLLHLNDLARAATEAVDGELRRAFGRGARGLLNQSLLKIYPAPTRLQAVIDDVSHLPREVAWSFGHVVWKCWVHAVRRDDGVLAGFAVAWEDESARSRAQAAFERLRAEAEDLPVPVMFPDATCERWYGNAACEVALQRLGPYLARPVNPLDGVPVQLFFPDEEERTRIFRDPKQLPAKKQVKIGPETVAVLVTAVLDEEQRYLGPQMTWEIVHFTPEAQRQPAPAPDGKVRHSVERSDEESLTTSSEKAGIPRSARDDRPGSSSAPARDDRPGSPSTRLRDEARSVEAAAQELLLFSRLLLSVADEAQAQDHVAPVSPEVLAEEAVKNRDETTTVAHAALAVLEAARGVTATHPRREETEKALATLNGIARRANRLALDGALLAVQDETAVQSVALADASRQLSAQLVEQVRALSARAQASTDVLRQGAATAARLAGLRAQLGDAAGREGAG